VRSLKAVDTPISKFDGGGLFLLVQPGGGKWWRFKYTFGGKTKTISFGTYPEITLKEAREQREQAKKLVAHNIDPSEDRKERKRAALATVTTFQDVFTEWLDIESSKLSVRTVDKIRSSMKIHALPKIGSLPIADIKLDVLLVMLRTIEAKGALEMARRVRAWTSRVFRYAMIVGKCERDPANDLQGALRVPVVKHHAALSAADLPAFLKALDDPLAHIAALTRLALKLIVMTAIYRAVPITQPRLQKGPHRETQLTALLLIAVRIRFMVRIFS